MLTALIIGASALANAQQRLTVVVMDPLCDRLACACVKGYAQRNYEALGKFLEMKLNRPVKMVYGEDLARALALPSTGKADLIIGKYSVVQYDAKECSLAVRPIASLTGKDGKTTLTGLIVVRKKDPAKKLSDLKGRTIFFGQPDADEKNKAAFATLRKAGVEVPAKVKTFAGCSDAALAVLESKQKPAPAGVISSYAAALIEGCGTVPKGALRIIGQTEPLPFVTAFATDHLSLAEIKEVQKALASLPEDPMMLRIMETKKGFLPLPLKEPRKSVPAMPVLPRLSVSLSVEGEADWPGWRGPNRNGSVLWLPDRLPAKPRVVWTQPLTNSGLAGVSVSGGYVVVADRDAKDENDIFRCFQAADGKPVWKLIYPAVGRLDYGNSPRATPTIADGKVYLLGAFGDFHCLDLVTGKTIWNTHLEGEFGAKKPTWGYASSPLLVDDKVIINPGGPQASLVALNAKTGEVVWKTPGAPAAYGSFVLGELGGKRQIVGYDANSLGGWDPATGSRLWTVTPAASGDFNVPTPSVYQGRLIVSTENNGTRVYCFSPEGKVLPKPLVTEESLSPDTTTPIVAGDRLVGCRGELICLNLTSSPKVAWTASGSAFHDYCSFFSCGSRVLMMSFRGQLLLFDVKAKNYQLLGKASTFDPAIGSYSHPAFVGKKLFVRSATRLTCYDLGQ